MSMSLIRLSGWKGVAVVAVMLAVAGANKAAADVLAQWTFESSVPTTSGPHAAEVGLGSAIGSTGGGASVGVYSNPVGNGSLESFSSNGWDVGDFYQFSLSTLGFENITVAWDQFRSSTGPADFTLAYSTTEFGTYTSFTNYTVLSTPSFSSTTYKPELHFDQDLSAISLLEDASTIFFRLISNVTTAAGGTNRVDNFTVSGTAIPDTAPVPLPSSLLVFGGCAGVAGVARRRLKAILG